MVEIFALEHIPGGVRRLSHVVVLALLVACRRRQLTSHRPPPEVQHCPAEDQHDHTPPEVDVDRLGALVEARVGPGGDAVEKKDRAEQPEQGADREPDVEVGIAAHLLDSVRRR